MNRRARCSVEKGVLMCKDPNGPSCEGGVCPYCGEEIKGECTKVHIEKCCGSGAEEIGAMLDQFHNTQSDQ